MENLIIRKRTKEDSQELAHCIATVWNTTYKGIVSDEFLENLLKGEKDSAKRLENNLDEKPFYYVLTLDDKIIGWTCFMLDAEGYENTAEIQSLYVLKEYQKKGYGKLLYNYAVKEIKSHGIKKLIIGCLDGNPSNEFYKHLGGSFIGTSLFRDEYLENIYLFEI